MEAEFWKSSVTGVWVIQILYPKYRAISFVKTQSANRHWNQCSFTWWFDHEINVTEQKNQMSVIA